MATFRDKAKVKCEAGRKGGNTTVFLVSIHQDDCKNHIVNLTKTRAFLNGGRIGKKNIKKSLGIPV